MMFDLHTVFTPGMDCTVRRTVTLAETAAQAGYGNRNLGHVIAPHVYIAMMAEATLGVVGHRLPEGLTSVARSMEFTHTAPSCLGMQVSVKVTLTVVNGERLYFDAQAWDDYGTVGYGKYERTVVHIGKLFERVNERLLKR